MREWLHLRRRKLVGIDSNGGTKPKKMERYEVVVVDPNKFGDIDVELRINNTETDRKNKPIIFNGTVSIDGMDIWGHHHPDGYVQEHGFKIVDHGTETLEV